MKTDTRFYATSQKAQEYGIVANFSCSIEDTIVIKAQIRKSRDGEFFVSYPGEKGKDGEYYNYVYALKQDFNNFIITEYKRWAGIEKQQKRHENFKIKNSGQNEYYN